MAATSPHRARRRPDSRRCARRVRRERAARSRGHPRLRALRHLPAPVPDVPGPGAGDGLPARARLPDARRHGRPHRADRQLHPPHGPLPRLSRVRDGVPGGRSVRPAPRGDARADRALDAEPARAPAPGPTRARRVPGPAAARPAAPAHPALPAIGPPAGRPGLGAPATVPPAGGDGAAASGDGVPAPRARSRPRPCPRARHGEPSRSSRAASRRSSSRRSTARP